MHNVSLPAVSALIPYVSAGCIKQHGPDRFEVWGEDISEHYALYLHPDAEPMWDWVLLPTATSSFPQFEGKDVVD